MATLTTTLRPLGERVLIKPLAADDVAGGGIIIPDVAKEKPQRGEVVAVGEGRRLEDGMLVPMVVRAGQRVLYGKYSGAEFKHEGNDLLIVKESEILAIIE